MSPKRGSREGAIELPALNDRSQANSSLVSPKAKSNVSQSIDFSAM